MLWIGRDVRLQQSLGLGFPAGPDHFDRAIEHIVCGHLLLLAPFVLVPGSSDIGKHRTFGNIDHG